MSANGSPAPEEVALRSLVAYVAALAHGRNTVPRTFRRAGAETDALLSFARNWESLGDAAEGTWLFDTLVRNLKRTSWEARYGRVFELIHQGYFVRIILRSEGRDAISVRVIECAPCSEYAIDVEPGSAAGQ